MDEFKKFMKVEVRLFDGGLIAISLLVLQVWIATGAPDVPSKISLCFLVVSLPMIVADLLLCHMPDIQFGSKVERFLAGHIRDLSWRGVFAGVVFSIAHASWAACSLFMLMSVICYIIYNRIWFYTKKSLEIEQKKLAKQKPH
jgi:hypothetical protein